MRMLNMGVIKGHLQNSNAKQFSKKTKIRMHCVI
jgi:hypothetical protein